MSNPNGFRSLYIWSVSDAQLHRVSSDLFNSADPAWDPDGDYLYFIGTREYAPQLSQIEFNFATNRGRSLLALTLRKDGKNPYPPESDEVAVSKSGEEASEKSRTPDKKDEKKEEKKETDKPKDDAKDNPKPDDKAADKADDKAKGDDAKAKSAYLTETRFTKTGMERRTVSDFGLIGSIIAQLNSD